MTQVLRRSLRFWRRSSLDGAYGWAATSPAQSPRRHRLVANRASEATSKSIKASDAHSVERNLARPALSRSSIKGSCQSVPPLATTRWPELAMAAKGMLHRYDLQQQIDGHEGYDLQREYSGAPMMCYNERSRQIQQM